MAYAAEATEKKDGHEVARENHYRYLRARDAGHKKFIEKALKCDRFYRGEQWDPKDTAKLDADGRPWQTFNFILPTINTASGELLSQAADFLFKPKRGRATQEIAGSLTKLAMHICDANGYSDGLEKDMVDDGLITGRGYLDIRIDFSDNVLGEVRMTPRSALEVIPDPTAREYDPATWNEVIVTRWLSLDEIASVYGPKAAQELKYYSSSSSLLNDDSIEWEERQTYGDSTAFDIGALSDIETNRIAKAIRVVERQYYKMARVKEFVDPTNGDIREIPASWSEEKAGMYAQAKQLETRERLTRKVRWTVSADCVLLHDDWSPYPTFTIVPFFCYFRRGKPFGIVDNLISPQETTNKVESQVLHVVNTTANSGWIVDTGALANMTVDELAQKGAQTGLVIEKNPGREIEKITPNQVPNGLTNISERSIIALREISGVNAAMQGIEGTEVSGVALENKTMRGAIQLQTVRENLKRTRRLVALKIVELVQRFYSEERIFFLTNHDGETEELVVNVRDAAGAIANDLTVGEYDVVVSTQPARDNFEDSQFAQAMALREAGIVVPDHRVIQYSGLHRKYELMDEVKQLTGFGEPTPQSQMMEELQMKAMQAEVEKLMAEVQKIAADAQYASARAGTEAQKPALERERMQADLAITAEEQSVRMQVQRLKEMSSQLQKMIDANVKIRTEKEKAKAKPTATPRKPSSGNSTRRK